MSADNSLGPPFEPFTEEEIEGFRTSLIEMRQGKFMSWQIALAPIPEWAKRGLSFIVDWPVRRRVRSLVKAEDQHSAEGK